MFYCEPCRDRTDWPRNQDPPNVNAVCDLCGRTADCHEQLSRLLPAVPAEFRGQHAAVRLVKGEVRKVVVRDNRLAAERIALSWHELLGLDEAMCQTNLEANGRYLDADAQVVVQVVRTETT